MSLAAPSIVVHPLPTPIISAHYQINSCSKKLMNAVERSPDRLIADAKEESKRSWQKAARSQEGIQNGRGSWRLKANLDI
jgi:hypothetical protein